MGADAAKPSPESSPFAALPPVNDVVAAARRCGSSLGEDALVAAIQGELARQRDAIAAGERPSREMVSQQIAAAVASLDHPRLARVLNATGVIVHTNLGRAPVSAETARAMAEAAAGAVPLELEPATNERGGRMREISTLMRLLTGAEATLVVNNCAAALVLTVSALAAGNEVIVSRGELVEIGGGFRIPVVMRQSGATLVEVGTTNRTYALDYAAAVSDRTAALLKVHASNFQVVGFVHAPTIAELAAVAQPHGLAVVEDLGSGALLDTSVVGLQREPMIGESLAAGADVVMISGDKLLGGPQAGIIAGGAAWVSQIARHPLARALRADKTCLAGVAATLRHYARGEAMRCIPVWQAMAASADGIRDRANRVAAALGNAEIRSAIEPVQATVGGGSLPGQTLPSWAVALRGNETSGGEVAALATRVRLGRPGVYGRIEHGALLLDLRTVAPADDELVIDAVIRAWGNAAA